MSKEPNTDHELCLIEKKKQALVCLGLPESDLKYVQSVYEGVDQDFVWTVGVVFIDGSKQELTGPDKFLK